MRILHLPVDLGGHARALAAAQRGLGHDAICVSLAWSPLGFNGDLCHDLPLGAPGRLPRREVGRLRLLWRSLAWADVVHCHFGQTSLSVRALPLTDPDRSGLGETAITAYARALWLKDLALWRMAGKRVAMTWYGDDCRLVDRALARNPWTHLSEPSLRAAMEPRDALKRELVSRLERAGVTMFALNPDLLEVLPETAAFLPYGHVDPARHQPRPPAESGPLRLLHMPTSRDVKGTSHFIAAVERLKAEGHDLSLTLVEGQPNAEALAILAGHDILLDQIRVGWFGGVAVEAMAMAKPVLAYLNPTDIALAPRDYAEALPILTADPSSIEARLREIVAMPRGQLREVGLRSRGFVERYHSPPAIARTVTDAYGYRQAGS